ncbi:MAG TPA: hypothetical protein VFZ66_00675 [Herpetosiphonaceae bacterium]
MATHTKGRSVPRRRRLVPAWLWLGLVALLVVGGATLAVTALRGPSEALVPAHTTHDFGTVSMRDGLISAQFPVTVKEPTLITDVSSS